VIVILNLNNVKGKNLGSFGRPADFLRMTKRADSLRMTKRADSLRMTKRADFLRMTYEYF